VLPCYAFFSKGKCAKTSVFMRVVTVLRLLRLETIGDAA
jgi:hypothetical protein